MTTVQKCSECDGLFSFLPRGVCADCLDQLEKDFDTVREYLHTNRGVTVGAVAEATEVAESRIQKFIAEGRIEFASADLGGAECEVCGTAIPGGTHCGPCRARLVAGMSKAFDAPVGQPRLGMHSRGR